MNSETDLAKDNERIIFDEQKLQLRLKDPKPDLCYIMLSTEPGRKIIHPPFSQNNQFCFSLEPSDGINQQCEYFCAIGLANCLTEIDEIVYKSHPVKKSVKTIYISKEKIGFKASTCSQRIDTPTKKKKAHLNIYPPCDLNAHEIQPILQEFQANYGAVNQVDVKKNCLVLSFQEQIQIEKYFKIKKLRSSDSGEAIVTYWSITGHQPLFTFEPIKLIQLPADTAIYNLTIQADWAIFSTSTQVLFLHLYKPLELFLTIPDIKPQGIFPLGNSKVIILQYKYIHAYQVHSNKNPTHLGTGKTKKIQPFSIAYYKNTAILGGINYSYMLNEPICEKYLHVFENFTLTNFHNKSLLADRTFQLCKKQQNDPIKNLTYISDLDLFFCSCANSIYLFHLQTQSLIASVDLNGTIHKIYEVDYPINLINILVKLEEQAMLVRVSFEQYCQIMGTEVGPAENHSQTVDFIVTKGKKKKLFMTDGELIMLYENSHNKALFSCDQDKKILTIYTSNQSLVFAVESSESLQIFFQQI